MSKTGTQRRLSQMTIDEVRNEAQEAETAGHKTYAVALFMIARYRELREQQADHETIAQQVDAFVQRIKEAEDKRVRAEAP